MAPDFQTQVKEWSSPPVDHLNAYIPSAKLLELEDDELRELIAAMEAERYGGWRNHGGLWRSALGLDSTHGKRVLDFGCGVGLEALQFAKTGNRISLADISKSNLELAQRVIRLCAPEAHGSGFHLVSDQYPFILMPRAFVDVFYCNGVLHHIWYPQEIMQRAWEILAPGGEARLMVYSDYAWRNYITTEPPEDTANDPGFSAFVRAFDQVGHYADWYDQAKVERLFGEWFDVEDWIYLTPWRNYAAVTLRRKQRTFVRD